MHDRIGDLVKTPEWESSSSDDKQDEVDRLAKVVRKTARERVLGGNASTSVTPPPPPGFELVAP